LLSYCDNTGEPLAGMMRRGGAGANTVADHLAVREDSIAALPPEHRRRLMVTCDGAGASHGLIGGLDDLAARPGMNWTSMRFEPAGGVREWRIPQGLSRSRT
jgi:hypothetical protein